MRRRAARGLALTLIMASLLAASPADDTREIGIGTSSDAASPAWPAQTSPTWQPSLEVPAGQTLVVIGQSDDEVHLDYVDAMDRGAAGYMYYVRLHEEPAALRKRLEGLSTFLEDERVSGAALDIGLTMGTSPVWDTVAGNPAGPGAVDVLAGAYDEQLGILAEWMNGLGTVVFLRIGYEFDLLGGQWGTPDQFAAGFRYMVDALRAEDVDNAAYVWHSSGAFFRAFDYSGAAGLVGGLDKTGASGPAVSALATNRDPVTDSDLLPIELYYPGDGYVDYFATSYWDDACCFGRGTDESRVVYRQRTRELLDQGRAMGLPLMIGEATPAYIGATSGEESVAWFAGLLDLVEEYDIRVVNVISQDWQAKPMWQQPQWNGFWPDSRVHVDATVCALWVERTSVSRYIHGAQAEDARPCASAQ